MIKTAVITGSRPLGPNLGQYALISPRQRAAVTVTAHTDATTCSTRYMNWSSTG